MQKILIAISRELYTGADTVLGMFPDTEEGMKGALGTAGLASDEPFVYRVPFGVAITTEQWEEVVA